MKNVLVSLVGLWMFVGGFAAFQRGDFADETCSTVTDTALVVVVGPLNYAVSENVGLGGSCDEPH